MNSIRPVNMSDPMWHYLARWIRLGYFDPIRGRCMEHVRR